MNSQGHTSKRIRIVLLLQKQYYEMKTLQYRGNATYFSFCKIGLKPYERRESAVQLPENEVSVFDNKHPKTTYMSQ